QLGARLVFHRSESAVRSGLPLLLAPLCMAAHAQEPPAGWRLPAPQTFEGEGLRSRSPNNFLEAEAARTLRDGLRQRLLGVPPRGTGRAGFGTARHVLFHV